MTHESRISEVAQLRTDILSGRLPRRDALKRALFLGLSAPAAMSLLAACAEADDDAPAAETVDDDDPAEVEPDDDLDDDLDDGDDDEPVAEPDDDSPSGQIVIGLSQEPTQFHPLMPAIEVDNGIHYSVFDTLWGVDENGEFYPNLAVEVPSTDNGDLSEDGLTWTVRLRDDVTWQDGEPFTAEDVKFTWELIMNPDFQAMQRSGHDLITEFEVVDTHTVRWMMSEVSAPYMSVLSRTFIVPKHILEDVEDPNQSDFNSNPIGTGAYRFVEQVTGDRIVLEAREDGYHRDGPHTQAIVIRYIPDLTMLYTNFRTGEVDYTGIQGITTEHYDEAITLEDREIVLIESAAIESIWFNYGIDMFHEKEVREALYYGMDKDTIVEDIYQGLPNHTETLLPASWASNDDLPQHEYNPERAIEILEEAGWEVGADGIREKSGTRLSFENSTTAGHQIREQTQAFLQQTWAEIGVEFIVDNHPPAVVWGEFWTQSQFQTLMVGYNYGVGPDPDFRRNWHSQGDNNWSLYENEDLDALLEEAVLELDLERRAELYREAQAIFREDLAILPIKQFATIRGHKTGLHGFTPNPNVTNGMWNLHEWYWES